MLLDSDDFMDQGFLFGDYDPGLVALIRRIIRPGDTCVDIGAHKGYVTLWLGSLVGAHGQVVAIEPDPRAMRELRENCLRNGFRHILCLPCAIGDHNGTCELVLTSQMGYSTRFPNAAAAPLTVQQISVEAKTLDSVLAQAGISPRRHRLPFVKIDAEGSEPLILTGMFDTLRAFRPIIWMEVNRESLRAADRSSKEMEMLLRPLGYQFFLPCLGRTRRFQRSLNLLPIRDFEDLPDVCNVLLLVPSSPHVKRLSDWRR